MQIPTGCRVGLLRFPADSTKTQPRNSPYFHSCANILDDIFTGAMEALMVCTPPKCGEWSGGRGGINSHCQKKAGGEEALVSIF